MSVRVCDIVSARGVLELNWDEIRPGLRIQIKDSHGRQGQIAEDKIDFASPGELVLNNIRIGMLTAPPVSNGHYMLNDPVRQVQITFKRFQLLK